MRNLDFASNSPRSIKLGDSNDALSLRVTELDQPVDLSKVSSIVVKIGTTSGFLTDVDVDVSSLQHPTDGIIDVVITNTISSKLTAGDYLLEVWINDAQGNTVIYPDTSYPTAIGFSIEKNIMSATSTVITTLTLTDFETRFNKLQEDLQYKVATGYFKGDKGDKGDTGGKGDTGTVDNTGLINSQAFQSLQTQVDTSAVGINLVLGTSSQVVQASNWNIQVADIKYDKSLGDNLCASVMINNADYASNLVRGNAYIILTTFDSSGNILATAGGKNISYNANGLSQCSISINDDTADIKAYIRTNNMNQNAFYSCLKIEKGSVATDWSPNPSEILTQSDYAKIKAAIVALGGTLS